MAGVSSSTATTVARPNGVCAVSGEPIAPGMTFMAALQDTPQGFVRLDVLPQHWEQLDRSDVMADWRTVMPTRQERKRVLADDGVLLELFEQLADAEEHSRKAFRYVLGLLLVRKRLLVMEGSTRDTQGREVLQLRRRGTEVHETFDLLDPGLDDEQLEHVSTQLRQILHDGVEVDPE